jgi:hypothetical protein
MAISVACHSCGNTLQAPDHLAGRKAKCAACGSIVVVDAIGIPEAIRISKPKPRPKPRPVIAEEEPIGIPEAIRSSKPKATPKPKQAIAEEEPVWAIPLDPEPAEVVAEVDVVAEVEDDEAAWVEEVPGAVGKAKRREKRKRKRRRQQRESSEPGSSTAIWWAGGVGALLIVVVGLVLWAIAAGHTDELIVDAISIAFLLPFSLVILFVSMLIASQFAGGIDFGYMHTAIPKALLLLFVVNLISVVLPLWIGFIFTFPVWFFGLMILFRLDVWEAMFVSFINNTILRLIMIFGLAFVLSAMNNAKHGGDRDDAAPDRSPALKKGFNPNQFQLNDIRPDDMQDD